MGQRSQIYVRYNKQLVIANYYQWNFGDRMISRARYGLDYLTYYLKNGFTWVFTNKKTGDYEKIRRYFDVNFDYQDIVISSDLFKEWEEEKDSFKDWTINDWVFNADNNDGRLFIDITFNEETNEYTLKYCFTDRDNKKPLTPRQYMAWDYPKWKTSEYIEDDIKKATEDNLDFIKKNFTLMTQEELEDYLNTDYTSKQEEDN